MPVYAKARDTRGEIAGEVEGRTPFKTHAFVNSISTVMTADPELHRALMRTFVRRTVVSLVLVGVLLFGAAGTLNWPEAWLYLALAAAISFGAGSWMARNDPALLAERLRSPFQREQKPWDKAVMAVMMALWIGWLVVMGLDVRYHWSDVPTILKAAGFVLIVLGSYVVGLTFKANSYAAPVVKIQTGRGHAVATSGPYAYVRHPMYAGALFFFVGVPVLLGSWWGLAAAPALVLIIALRAVLEERTLAAELDGYADYAARVRYRFVPYLW
jgi:protein-S-isoprenylcysteine O-methyltransferase Ste14